MATSRLLFKTIYDLDENEIKVGSRVVITSQGSYTQCLIGKTGEVRSLYAGNVGVLLDDTRNERSGYGHFYFSGNQLRVVNDDITEFLEDENMVLSEIKNYLNVVRVRISGETKPCMNLYANFEPDIAVGDLVVIKQTYGMAVAIVEEILEGDNFTVQREVVTKVNTDAFNNRVRIREQAAELKAKMEERAKQLQDVVLYKTLAESDPAMKELLNEYLALVK